jgi:MoaA/NifB/PqqE/SkfB family radical SAM enzyme
MKRLDVKTGAVCNNNCVFCAQSHMRKYGNRSIADIKRYLALAKKDGCAGVVFTGGEPTIREDIVELVAHAKKLGYERIQLQTNGRALSYLPLCRKLIAAGANEFCIALHAHTAKLHDSLTNSPGSHKQTTQAIKNLVSQGAYVMANTVVVKQNYRYLPQLAKLFVRLRINQFQFAFVHAVGSAKDNIHHVMPKMSDAAPYVKEGLQIGIDAEIKVMVEAMPQCTLQGYEQYCSELQIPETEIRGINQFDPDYAKTRKILGKVKFTQCRRCKFDKTCEGPWKEYPEIYGSREFVSQ